MSNPNTKEEAIEQMKSKENQELLSELQAVPGKQLANGEDFAYRAYKRPYQGSEGTYVLILLANGWYSSHNSGASNLYFEQDGQSEFKLMQTNSPSGSPVIIYKTTEWTSGIGLSNIEGIVSIKDAYGTHVVQIEPM